MSAISPRTYAQMHVEGYKDSEIAELCSVSPSYISQLSRQELTVRLIEEVRESSAASKAAQVLDDGYDRLEVDLLKKLATSVNFLSKPMEIARVLQTINAAKRRRGPLSQPTGVGAPIVQLIVPVAIQNKIMLSDNNEVLAVDGRNMVTLPAANLSTVLEKRNEQARLTTEAGATGNTVLDAIGPQHSAG